MPSIPHWQKKRPPLSQRVQKMIYIASKPIIAEHEARLEQHPFRLPAKLEEQIQSDLIEKIKNRGMEISVRASAAETVRRTKPLSLRKAIFGIFEKEGKRVVEAESKKEFEKAWDELVSALKFYGFSKEQSDFLINRFITLLNDVAE